MAHGPAPHRGRAALSAAAPGCAPAYPLRIVRAQEPVTWPELREASAAVGLPLRRVGHGDCEWQRPVRGWGLEPVLGGGLRDGVVTVVGATTDPGVAARVSRLVRLLDGRLQGESGEEYAVFPVLSARQAAACGRRTAPPLPATVRAVALRDLLAALLRPQRRWHA